VAKAPIEIRSLARKHTDEALNRLAYWMRSDNAKASVAATVAILDRGWGKAVQAVEVSGEIASKVIRSPSVSETAKDWAADHVPDHMTEH